MTCLIDFAFSLVLSAKFRILSATTENPFPASPALAASMLAFNDKILVCVAISLWC